MPSVYIFCTSENIFHPPMFDAILENRSIKVVGAGIFPGTKNDSMFNIIKKVMAFDGTIAPFRLVRSILVHRLQRFLNPDLHPARIEDVFAKHGIRPDYFQNPNAPECIRRVKDIGVEIILNNQPLYLKQGILAAPILACLNKHTSALPAYRGVEPVFHALLAEEPLIGVSIHSMELDIDAGYVYAQTFVKAEKSVFECYKATFSVSASLFSKALDNLMKGEYLFKIDPRQSYYYRSPTKEQIARFRQLGLSYL